MSKKNSNRLILGVLIGVLLIYNIILYNFKTTISSSPHLTEEALEGELLWQENNCAACHQLYGLGGYLGPDLTNVISDPAKGRDYVKEFFNSGVSSMPRFSFTETEKEALASFLEKVDKTGHYPNRSAEFHANGWVTIEYK